jgi:hypothetical protein
LDYALKRVRESNAQYEEQDAGGEQNGAVN